MKHRTWCDTRYFADAACNCAPKKVAAPRGSAARCPRCGMAQVMTIAVDGPAFSCPSCGYTEEA